MFPGDFSKSFQLFKLNKAKAMQSAVHLLKKMYRNEYMIILELKEKPNNILRRKNDLKR